MNKLSIAVCTVALLMLPSLGQGLPNPFDVGLGVRAMGFGGAYTALAQGTEALLYNPAGLAYLPGIRADSSYSMPMGLYSVAWLAGAMPNFGAGLAYLSAGGITDPQGDPLTFSHLGAVVGAGFPADRIYRAPERTTDVPGAFAAANGLLTQHPEVKRWLVFSVNDEGVLGAIRAMEGRGYDADSILAIGIGAGTGLQEFLKPKPTGYFATCLINPFRHGYETTELLYKWIKDGVEPPRDIRTKGVMCTRENFREVLKKLGLEDVLER